VYVLLIETIYKYKLNTSYMYTVNKLFLNKNLIKSLHVKMSFVMMVIPSFLLVVQGIINKSPGALSSLKHEVNISFHTNEGRK